MRATRQFTSFEQYEKWTERFEGCYEYDEIPTVIDDGWKVAADLFTDCRSWRTALRRFAKAFSCVDESVGIKGWVEGMEESCENGYFEDINGWRSHLSHDKEENDRLNMENARKFGCYGWGVEEVGEGRWYIFLNISGIYAGREERTA